MAFEIKMPALSPTMEEGTLAKWLVREGDAVRSGDILAEIETDKATMEFEATDEGVVSQILVAEGTDGIMVGATIALLLRDAEAPARTIDVPRGETLPAKPQSDLAVMSSEAAEHGDDGLLVENTTTQPRSTPGAAAGVLPDVSPLARRIIEQQGIDVAQVKGSGPAGRVIRADLVLERQPVILTAAAPTPAKVGPPEGVPFETVELSAMRRTTARQLTESKR